MPERFALYFAPAEVAPLTEAATSWLAQADLRALTVSARRYGFHATLKAPMGLASGMGRPALEAAIAKFAERRAPVGIGYLRPQLLDGFLALTPVEQPAALTEFAADVVRTFEPLRAPLGAAEMARRMEAPLTARQVELLETFGYPYVLEQFLFHMTLTDRLAEPQRTALLGRAEAWFAEALARPVWLDRLVLFHEAEAGAPFERLADFALQGPEQ